MEKKSLMEYTKRILCNGAIILVGSLAGLLLMSALYSLTGGTMEGVRFTFFEGIVLGFLALSVLPLLFLLSFLVVVHNKPVNSYMLGVTALVFVVIGAYCAPEINSYIGTNFSFSWSAGSILGLIFGKPSNLLMLGVGILLNFLVLKYSKVSALPS